MVHRKEQPRSLIPIAPHRPLVSALRIELIALRTYMEYLIGHKRKHCTRRTKERRIKVYQHGCPDHLRLPHKMKAIQHRAPLKCFTLYDPTFFIIFYQGHSGQYDQKGRSSASYFSHAFRSPSTSCFTFRVGSEIVLVNRHLSTLFYHSNHSKIPFLKPLHATSRGPLGYMLYSMVC